MIRQSIRLTGNRLALSIVLILTVFNSAFTVLCLKQDGSLQFETIDSSGHCSSCPVSPGKKDSGTREAPAGGCIDLPVIAFADGRSQTVAVASDFGAAEGLPHALIAMSPLSPRHSLDFGLSSSSQRFSNFERTPHLSRTVVRQL